MIFHEGSIVLYSDEGRIAYCCEGSIMRYSMRGVLNYILMRA